MWKAVHSFIYFVRVSVVVLLYPKMASLAYNWLAGGGGKGERGEGKIVEDSLELDQCWLSRDILILGAWANWVIDAESGTGASGLRAFCARDHKIFVRLRGLKPIPSIDQERHGLIVLCCAPKNASIQPRYPHSARQTAIPSPAKPDPDSNCKTPGARKSSLNG